MKCSIARMLSVSEEKVACVTSLAIILISPTTYIVSRGHLRTDPTLLTGLLSLFLSAVEILLPQQTTEIAYLTPPQSMKCVTEFPLHPRVFSAEISFASIRMFLGEKFSLFS